VIVNTDSPHYAEIARHYGAEVPFLRPPAISGKASNIGDARKRMLDHYAAEGVPVEKVIEMLPTNPFRNRASLQKMVDALDAYCYAGTAYYVNIDWGSLAVRNDGGFQFLQPLMHRKPPEDLACFKITGHFHGENLAKMKAFYDEKTLRFQQKKRWHFMNKKIFFLVDPVELIDIDTPEDFDIAERIIEDRLYAFGCELS